MALDAYNLDAVRSESPQIRNFIGGEFVEPISGKYLDNIEPATGTPYSQVADSDAHDVDLADTVYQSPVRCCRGISLQLAQQIDRR